MHTVVDVLSIFEYKTKTTSNSIVVIVFLSLSMSVRLCICPYVSLLVKVEESYIERKAQGKSGGVGYICRDSCTRAPNVLRATTQLFLP
jgi:hypothetical protein